MADRSATGKQDLHVPPSCIENRIFYTSPADMHRSETRHTTGAANG